MIGKKTFVALAVTTALSVLGAASAAGMEAPGGRERGGYVIACSLAGVNPVHHPDIFGNAAVARSYGFVQSRDGTWHVQNNCVRGLTVPY